MNHFPVLFREVMKVIKPYPGRSILDCTFGLGGHTQGFLSYGASVIGIDRDCNAVAYGKTHKFSRFDILHSRFSQIGHIFAGKKFDAIFFDFGLSSPQIDNPDFGMSFKKNGPLNMQMGLNKFSAYDFINYAPEKMIADVIYWYGEERQSRQIAQKICEFRKEMKIESTSDLRSVVHSIVKYSGKIDPATRTFQAIRIHVNNELSEIEIALNAAAHLLNPNGVICCISFHSLEDRIVKNFFRRFTRKSSMIIPTKEEVTANPRSRSAKLRFYSFK